MANCDGSDNTSSFCGSSQLTPFIGALYYTNWEQNGDQGCYIPVLPADGSAPAPIQGNCTLGDMSSYVVNATSVDDIVTTVNFAAEKKLRFRIKNVSACYVS